MKLLILGAGHIQENAIRKAKALGHTVIVSDYYSDPPGKAWADYHEQVSTFDIEQNIAIGLKYQIDGVMTLGTDQPVYTAACVAERLKLPSLLDVSTAKAVTNKKVMKRIFREKGIPTVNYVLTAEKFNDRALKDLRFPVVVKPLDSQGQRGVYKLQSITEIREVFQDVLSYSRERELLVEEYYPNSEITVSGWVKEGELFLISVVDRISLENRRHIGICTAHHFPSRFLKTHYSQIKTISESIVSAFQIKNGPVYFQMLIGREGVKVNEIACRIGGAYEDIYLERATGIDLLEMLIRASLNQPLDFKPFNGYDILANEKRFSVEMFFAKSCEIHSITEVKSVEELPGIIRSGFNFKPGDRIREIINATQRAGYFIAEGENEAVLRENVERAYGKIGIYDSQGNNQLIRLPEKNYNSSELLINTNKRE